MTTTPATVLPKHIPVNGRPIRARFAQQTGHSVLYGVIFGLVAAGLYYGITQVDWYVHVGPVYFHIFYLKPWWDHTLGTWLSGHIWFITQANWPDYRHSVARNLLEPALAVSAVMSLNAGRKYWVKRVGPVRLAVTLPLFLAAYLVLAAGGTWLILFGQSRFSPAGFSHGLWTVVQYGILGLAISQVLHRIFGPVGARAQGYWVERYVDHWWRHGAKGRVPRLARHAVVAPSIRERIQEKVNDDRANGEGEALTLQGARPVASILYWLAALAILIIAAIAFLGFIGHIWVGVLGHSFPYLAPS